MSIEEIKNFVNNNLIQSLDGANGIENNKFDFKGKWYQMAEEEGQFKFLIDATAIINSYGGGDGFLVIGYDEKKRSFIDSPFALSGLSDPANLIGIIRKKVDRPFNVQAIDHLFVHDDVNQTLCIIHIPPSLDKPHVIRNLRIKGQDYPNEVYVRKGSTNDRASKSDLDLMYAEKPNIIVERKAIMGIRIPYSSFQNERTDAFTTIGESNKVYFRADVSIENLGYRPLAINSVILDFNLSLNITSLDKLRMECKLGNAFPYGNPNIINANSVNILNLEFKETYLSFSKLALEEMICSLNKLIIQQDIFSRAEFILSNGERFFPELRLVRH